MDDRPLGSSTIYSIIGSIAGAAVSGAILTNWGLMDRIGALVGAPSATAGWILYMSLALLFGLFLGLLVARIPLHAVTIGLAWGATIWLLGFMILLPLGLGRAGQVLDLTTSAAWVALVAHLMYGLVAGAVAFAGVRRVQETGRTAHAG